VFSEHIAVWPIIEYAPSIWDPVDTTSIEDANDFNKKIEALFDSAKSKSYWYTAICVCLEWFKLVPFKTTLCNIKTQTQKLNYIAIQNVNKRNICIRKLIIW